MSIHDRCVELPRRHLGRDPKPSDGVSEAAIERCERRLGVAQPAAMHPSYRLAGRLDQLTQTHKLLFGLDELRIDDSPPWFMEENRAVVHTGLPARRLS